jgi:hypothetical protein
MFANKVKRVQVCIDAGGRHFQHLLYVHSDFPNALYSTHSKAVNYIVRQIEMKKIKLQNYTLAYTINLKFGKHFQSGSTYSKLFRSINSNKHIIDSIMKALKCSD